VECLARYEVLGDLSFELDAMSAVLGHGFHPLKARQRRSIPNLQTVHRHGRTPNTCHQLYFNNQDGQFSDNGHVDCARAVADLSKDKPKNSSTARTEFISKGFR
jgi:hypothetical protein